MEILRSVAMLFAAVALLRSQVVLGRLECEELTKRECAFAVSSAGSRCVLEKSTLPNGEIVPSCQTSLIMAERPGEWIESNECIQGCGLHRETYGLSSDSLVESGFRDKLCSSECQNNCPNIVDIYFKLTAGEGVYLPRLCNEQKFRARRLIDEPVIVAQNGAEGGRRGGRLWSSTHTNRLTKQWDTSLASVGTPSPLPSPVYRVLPLPLSPEVTNKPVSISPVPAPAPGLSLSPTPVLTPAQSTLSQPIEEISTSSYFGNDDFDDGEI